MKIFKIICGLCSIYVILNLGILFFKNVEVSLVVSLIVFFLGIAGLFMWIPDKLRKGNTKPDYVGEKPKGRPPAPSKGSGGKN